MKILAVSDEELKSHYNSAVGVRFPDIDLILGCGDLQYYYMDFLVSALNKQMFYVRGNHDCGDQWDNTRGKLTGVRGGENIHGRCVYYKGLLIAGLEGSVKYKPGSRCMFSQRQMYNECLKLARKLLWNRARYGRALDILVTHAPPYGIHDKPDLPHQGFRAYLRFMEIFKPRYLLHGHIHRYDLREPEMTQYAQTTVINVYPSYTLNFE